MGGLAEAGGPKEVDSAPKGQAAAFPGATAGDWRDAFDHASVNLLAVDNHAADANHAAVDRHEAGIPSRGRAPHEATGHVAEGRLALAPQRCGGGGRHAAPSKLRRHAGAGPEPEAAGVPHAQRGPRDGAASLPPAVEPLCLLMLQRAQEPRLEAPGHQEPAELHAEGSQYHVARARRVGNNRCAPEPDHAVDNKYHTAGAALQDAEQLRAEGASHGEAETLGVRPWRVLVDRHANGRPVAEAHHAAEAACRLVRGAAGDESCAVLPPGAEAGRRVAPEAHVATHDAAASHAAAGGHMPAGLHRRAAQRHVGAGRYEWAEHRGVAAKQNGGTALHDGAKVPSLVAARRALVARRGPHTRHAQSAQFATAPPIALEAP